MSDPDLDRREALRRAALARASDRAPQPRNAKHRPSDAPSASRQRVLMGPAWPSPPTARLAFGPGHMGASAGAALLATFMAWAHSRFPIGTLLIGWCALFTGCCAVAYCVEAWNSKSRCAQSQQLAKACAKLFADQSASPDEQALGFELLSRLNAHWLSLPPSALNAARATESIALRARRALLEIQPPSADRGLDILAKAIDLMGEISPR